MANTVVTTNGLNFMSSAHPAGPLFAIKYWVPVYDWRLDPDIRNTGRGYSATNLAIAEAQGRTYPAGEILWNLGLNAYILSDETDYQYILSGYGSSVDLGTDIITNSKQTMGPVPINLYDYSDTPIGNYYKGDKASFSTSTPGTWAGANLVLDPGGNTSYYSDPAYYYSVIDFLPVVEDGQTKVKAQFTCRLSTDVGSIKYNKLALYAIRYTGAGVVDSTPHFVGEAYLLSGYPIKKSRFGEGYNETTINVQLEFNMTSAWADVFYGSSADYWSKVPNGLHSSEKISVGTFQNANNEPMATAHFGRVINENADYENRPNLRLEYVDDTITNGNTFDLTVNFFGELEISASHPLINIHPMSPIEMGSSTFPFGTYIASATHFLNDDLGEPLFESSDWYYDRRSLTMYKRKFDFNDSSDDTYLENNKFAGGDIQRNYHDLILQSRQRSVYIIASVDAETHNLAMSRSVSNNYLYNNVDNYYLTSANTDGASTLFIAAKNGIKSKGPIELEYIPSKNYIDDVIGIDALNYMTDSGIVYSKNNKIIIMAGSTYDTFTSDQVNGSSKYFLDRLLNRMSSVDFDQYIVNYNFNPYDEGYISEDSEFHMMAYKNIFYGDLIPTKDNTFKIGSFNRRPSEILAKDFSLNYNYEADASNDSFIKGGYTTNYSETVLYRYLMRFAVRNNTKSYFSIGDDSSGDLLKPVDKIVVNKLVVEAGTNANNDIAGIYANGVDMSIQTVNAVTIDASNTITSDGGFYERNRTIKMGEWTYITDDHFIGSPSTFETLSFQSSMVYSCNLYQFQYAIIGKTLMVRYVLHAYFKNAVGTKNQHIDAITLNFGHLMVPGGTIESFNFVSSINQIQVVTSDNTFDTGMQLHKELFLKIRQDNSFLRMTPFGERLDNAEINNKLFVFYVHSQYAML